MVELRCKSAMSVVPCLETEVRVFIVVDGIDGSGKSTLARAVSARLMAEGKDVLLTREPTRGPHGAKLRQRATTGERFAPAEELALFALDRLHHLDRLIRPAIALDHWVVCDRYVYSTIAYQGERGISAGEVRTAHFPSFSRPKRVIDVPDVLFIVDVPVDVAMERIGRRGVPDAFEQRETLERVRERFLAPLPDGFGCPVFMLDGTLPPGDLVEIAMGCIESVEKMRRA